MHSLAAPAKQRQGAQPACADEDEQAEEATAWIVANRTGAVLGAHAILKEDHFPGCQSSKIPRLIPGAPNFRPVPGQNVYGSALPTIDGIRAMLAHVQAAPDSPGKVSAEKHAEAAPRLVQRHAVMQGLQRPVRYCALRRHSSAGAGRIAACKQHQPCM